MASLIRSRVVYPILAVKPHGFVTISETLDRSADDLSRLGLRLIRLLPDQELLDLTPDIQGQAELLDAGAARTLTTRLENSTGHRISDSPTRKEGECPPPLPNLSSPVRCQNLRVLFAPQIPNILVR